MNVLVQANVLTVGLGDREQVLRNLPIEITSAQTTVQAARSLKNEKFDSIISKWNSENINTAAFLQCLRTIKTDISMIVLVKANDPTEEIAARSIGVSMVLTEDCSDEFFMQSVISVLGLDVTLPEKVTAPGR